MVFNSINGFVCITLFPAMFSLVSHIYEMQVSDLINCGVYIFTPEIFTAIQGVSTNREDRGWSLLITKLKTYKLD